MPRYRFVDAELVRLPLSDGDWIDVKKELNAGEYRKLIYDQVKDTNGGPPVLDVSKVGLSKLLAYLVAWSFTNKQQQPEPYSLEQSEEDRSALLDNLDQATYKELIAAVTAHEAADDAKKNTPGGAIS